MPYDANSVICGGSEIACQSKVMAYSVMAYSNKHLLLFSWERGFSMGSSVIECTWAINTIQWVMTDILWVNAFANYIFTSVMASNTVNGI